MGCDDVLEVFDVFAAGTEKRTLMHATRSIRRVGDLTKCREQITQGSPGFPKNLKIR